MKNFITNTKQIGNTISRGIAGTVIICLLLFAENVQAQTAYKYSDGSRITVNGTSNLHAWTMSAGNFSIDAKMDLKGQQLQDLSALTFSLPVLNLKSKEDLMNTRAYKAMKSQQHTKITFKLSKAVVSASQRTIKATGSLTIAGKTNLVTIDSNYIVNGDEITIKGSKSIKMSDFDITAPSFMLGALKTGNDLIIDITLKLKKSTITAQNK